MLPIPAEELNGSGTLGPYWTFYRAVVAEQLSRWLPAAPVRSCSTCPAAAGAGPPRRPGPGTG